MTTKTAAEIYDQGYQAHVEGYGEENNPYSRDSEDWAIWLAGYRESEKECEDGK